MDRLRLAVIGVGHLGKEHARILSGFPDVELVGVVDARRDQARAIAERCQTQAYHDYRTLLQRPIDGAVVAVPTSAHHEVAVHFLCRSIPLLIEKPIANTLAEADDLVRLAREGDVMVQVGHIERFNPAFEELRERFPEPRFLHAQRLTPFSGRALDVGVVLDLMIHDLDLLLNYVGAPVREIAATGLSVLGGPEDIARATLTFANGCIAQVSASRVHSGPVRQMEVWGPAGFALADFHQRRLTLTHPAEQLLRLQRDARPLEESTLAALKAGLHGQYLESAEIDCNRPGPDQLTRELMDFVSALRQGKGVRVTAEAGREALTLAWRITECIRQQPCTLESAGKLFSVDSIRRAA